jgi:ABC-type thiamine transport system ATPase subunit
MNFFQPTMKLQSKTRHGASVNKVYETAQTPYQRLLQSVSLSEAKRVEMAVTYHRLNPVLLLKQINSNLEQLWRLAVRPASLGNRNYEATRRASVTV